MSNELDMMEQLRRTSDLAPCGIGLYDAETSIPVFLNKAYYKLIGYTEEEYEIHKSDPEYLIFPEDVSIARKSQSIYDADGKVSSTEYRIVRKDGTVRWVQLDISTLSIDGKQYAYTYFVDITSRIEAEQKSEYEKSRFELVANEMEAAVFEWDLQNGSFYCSEAYKKYAMSQVSTDDILHNRGPADMIHPDDMQEMQKFFAGTESGDDRVEVILRLKMMDGEYRWCRIIGLYYRDQMEKPTKTIGIIIDINEEHEENARLQKLLNSVPGGIGIYEIHGTEISQIYMNDAFYEMIGSKREDREQFYGLNAITSAFDEDVPRIRAALKALMEGSETTEIDYRLKSDTQGGIWIHAKAAVVGRGTDYIRLNIAFYNCTESKQQQLLMERNQHAVELAQSQGNMAIWTFNIDKGIIIQQTPADVNGHLGYPVEIPNVPECFFEGSVHPDDIDKFRAAYQKLQDNADKVDEIYRLMNLETGKYNWVHMYYQRMTTALDSDRMAVGFSLVVDKQQETSQRYELEKKLRKQMYANAIMYVEYNLTQRKYGEISVSSDHYKVTALEDAPKENYRERLVERVDETFAETVTEKLYGNHLLEAFEQGENHVSCEFRSKEESGLPSLWLRTEVTMVSSPDTGDVMAFVYVENIEEEKTRQLAMESSMEDGIESITLIRVSDGLARRIQADKDWAHPSLGDTFTYDDEFVGRSNAVILEEDREFAFQSARLTTVMKILEEQPMDQFSFSMLFKDGTFRRQLFRYRYLDDRRKEIVLSVCDITDVYMEDQEKSRQLKNSLEEAQKASHAKADFYSRMSHDMRTPMNGILGMTTLSENETDVGVLQSNIKKIRESGEYLLNLINDTLDIQRIESGKMVLEPQIVNTREMIEGLLDMLKPTAAAKGVNLKYSHGNADLDWYIRMDALRLKQIFTNLVSNAVKFTPAGGTVELAFALLSREGMISHDVVYVRDTGVGMSEAFLKNGIFKPFSQERNAVSTQYAGSGLGLSIAKSLVEMMGGRIEVESELGVGTTFIVYLDFERVEESEAKKILNREKQDNHASFAILKGRHILLAEDHPLNAEISRKLLEKAECIVTWAQNGQEAVTCIERSAPGFYDAILMDVRMPVMDGIRATKTIRNLQRFDAKKFPIIAMTANAYEEDVKICLDAGMDAHISKPVEPAKLYETIAEYIKKSKV